MELLRGVCQGLVGNVVEATFKKLFKFFVTVFDYRSSKKDYVSEFSLNFLMTATLKPSRALHRECILSTGYEIE